MAGDRWPNDSSRPVHPIDIDPGPVHSDMVPPRWFNEGHPGMIDDGREARRVKQDRLTRIARAVGWLFGSVAAVTIGLMMLVVVLLLVWAAEALIHAL